MGLFETEYKKLNARQRQAVDSIEGPLLVIAGPGTGKTQLLTTRVAAILHKTDAEPQNILCLTYTESAAYEMRQRLVNMIGQRAYNITISTYHAFGSELIRRFPEYFSDTTDLRPVDELGQHTIVEEIISNLPYDNPLRKASFYIKDVIGTISELKKSLLDPADLKKIAAANQKAILALSAHTKNSLAGLVRISPKSIPMFKNLARKTKPLAERQYLSPGILSIANLWQTQLDEALELCASSGKTNPLTKWKNNWLLRNKDNNFVVEGNATNKKLSALAGVYQNYLDALRDKKMYDYDDMILHAVRGLEANKELRYRLQEQYMYILLDEFQDTNAAQLKLVKLLSDNPIYEGKPNVLAVGDDDQAIYAFQGADYSHMLTFINMYQDVRIVSLSENYRSHRDILHIAHGIAEQIEERLHHHMKDVDKLLSAEGRQLPAKAQVERHEFKSDVSQYAWIAKQIGRLLKKGVSPSEIAVIAPKHRYLEPLVPYLTRSNVPLRYEKRENVLEDTHIVQLIRMSQLVICLNEKRYIEGASLWPEVLSYDFWLLPPEKIWQLSWRAHKSGDDWTNLLATSQETQPIAMFFISLSNLLNIDTLETLLDYLIGISELNLGEGKKTFRSPFYEYNFGKKRQKQNLRSFWSLLSNLTVLRQHLREYRQDEDKALTLKDLVQFAQEHSSADIKILNTSPYHESAEAVQIMTAYRAKGQEFEYVFVSSCVDEVWGSKASSQSIRVPLPPNLNFARYEGSNNDERLRLFFVALTRAKHGLYLTSYQNNFANKPTSRLKFLNEVEDGKKVISQLMPKTSLEVNRSLSEVQPDEVALGNYWQLRHLQAASQPKLASLLKHRLDTYQLAPTHLNNFTDLVYGGPQNFFITTILKFPKAPTPDGEFGNAMHETLEWIHIRLRRTGKLPSKTVIIKTFEVKLKSKHLSPRDSVLLLERGKKALEVFIAQRLKSFSPKDEPEFSFYNQGVFVGHAHMTGKIDKLIIERKKRTIKIVDYKTGEVFSKWGRNAKLHKYRQQLYLYKLLVEGAYQFADFTVEDACLEFIEPDEDGQITQLPIKFDTEEMARLKKLVGGVWDHIMKLDFPDTRKYSKDLKGILEFENDLISGKI